MRLEAQRLRVWLAWAVVLTPLAGLAQGSDGAACSLVYGHGRNFNPSAARTNALWDELNHRFNAASTLALQAMGRRSVALVHPVQARDVAANAQALLARAADEGCDELIETSVFADADTELLILRLRAQPLQRPAGAPRLASDLVIGAISASVQRELPLIDRTMARIGSGELARHMVAELRGR